ncbi:MAG: methylmalonyl Co-A mutase-associated GTPase MeaB [Cyclobacteriaceae bacterium]
MSDKVINKISIDELIVGINSGDRLSLSKAITLIESKRQSDQVDAASLIDKVIAQKHSSTRLGITGVPGVGKSTFIEAFGLHAIASGHMVAVLSVDPSSSLSKGSILGDKTRMTKLSQHERAFIRPSPAGDTYGGVAGKTRESILLCEAAGFDYIIVETVGVGQAEVALKDMVDFFLVLMLAGGGDELQGIKRGIMEMADAIGINKSDGENIERASIAKTNFENALHYFPKHQSGWQVPVETCSALTGDGIESIWTHINHFIRVTKVDGWHDLNRQQQNIHWMNQIIDMKIREDFYRNPETKDQLLILTEAVKKGDISVRSAINKIFNT